MIVKKLAIDGERLDYRRIDEQRPIEIEKYANSLFLSMGNTRVQVVFQSDVTRPYVDKPREGVIGFFASMAGRRHEKLLWFLNMVYVKQKCVDLESMCIKAGKEVMLVHIDFRFLSIDGNVYSIAVAGVNAALSAIGVSMNFLPKCFLYCSVERCILSDPTDDELDACDWHCIVVMKSRKEVVFFEKSGDGCGMLAIDEIINRSGINV
ncbi:RNase PH-like exoribonuclease [Ordospora colligata]|uniref:Ribosomal RNA-processing protein 42 n=1 Tax=Ordospora colligata OC4 TaxID=1354746 RepID=A0A0B2UKH0_9MICR|nr:RNase PH-like exoribonuclease [Ordospora colligata OC4]KHN69542.1 RNase PH-like exoribonuclease [Ordospora colligata OC4]TBU15362.1 RNase PH-like exoribonuclease [Ordospora colligata]TBU15462.1 RNase PH-like exoribonuclease [Ordospora colligata]TBU18558.1 RNase PH-like exoribonuclease [Ordospora colligata]